MDFRSSLIVISALLLGAGMLNLGLGLQGTLLGVRAGIEEYPMIVTGIVMSSYYAGFISGTFLAPKLINRVGHIRTFSALASLASAMALCHAIFVDPISWTIYRSITGLCFAGLAMVSESWLNEKSTNLNRGTILSTYMMVTLGSTAAGQMLLNLASPADYKLFVLVSVAISISLIPIALTNSPTPVQIKTRRLSVKEMYDASPVGVIGCLSAGLTTSAFWSLGAVYGQGVGLDITKISYMMTLLIAGGMVSQIPLGKLSDRLDRRLIILALCVGIFLIGGGISTGYLTGKDEFFIAVGIFGAMLLPVYGISIAQANDHLDITDFVPASATLLLMYGIGATLGPVVGASVMQLFGPSGLFGYAAFIALITGGFTLYRTTQRNPVAKEVQTAFVAVPRTTAMILEMASEGDENQLNEQVE